MTLQLTHCNTFFLVLPLKIAQKLQLVQKMPAHMVQFGWVASPRAAVAANLLPGPIQGAGSYL